MISRNITTFISFLAAIFIGSLSAKADNQDVIYTPYSVEIREKGGFLQKTGKELNTPEAKMMLQGACYALGCGNTIEKVAEYLMANIPQSGPNFRITGGVTKHDGEEWYFTFPGPAGYHPCDAALAKESDGSAAIGKNKGDSFQTAFRENRVDGYAVVPRNRPQGHWVFARFVVKYVKDGVKDPSCRPNGAQFFNCGPKSEFGDDCRQLW